MSQFGKTHSDSPLTTPTTHKPSPRLTTTHHHGSPIGVPVTHLEVSSAANGNKEYVKSLKTVDYVEGPFPDGGKKHVKKRELEKN